MTNRKKEAVFYDVCTAVSLHQQKEEAEAKCEARVSDEKGIQAIIRRQ